jgi:hypothetical protein
MAKLVSQLTWKLWLTGGQITLVILTESPQLHRWRNFGSVGKFNRWIEHLDGKYLPIEKAEMVLRLLLEGNSVSSVERATEVHHTTILKLLVQDGEKCERIMAEKVRNVEVRDVESTRFGRSSAKSKSAFVPKIARCLATAACGLESSVTPSWCSTSR